MSSSIIAKGVRVNNLKGVDVEIPRNRLVVITGLSGSGKSSLAFDTLYAEGQRRYVESLSAYARQFLGKMHKPEADFIRGLPPAIAIEQKVNTRNPRSTVGTSTEIYDYLRLLFGRIGKTVSPISGSEVKKHTVADVTAAACAFPEGTRMAVVAPLEIPQGRTPRQHLDILLKGGYTRLFRNGEFIGIEDLIAGAEPGESDLNGADLLIDRLALHHDATDEMSRLAESAEIAFFEGHDRMALIVWNGGSASAPSRLDFSTRFEADGMTFPEPTDMMFNFNNPVGACPRCEGFGKVMGIDESLVVPDPTRSVYDDAVVCWRGEKMSEWKHYFIRHNPDFPIHRPYADLSQAERDLLWHGPEKGGKSRDIASIDNFFRMVEENLYKIQYRVMLARYRGKTTCPDCHGGRLRPEAAYVKVGGRTIMDLVAMPVGELSEWFRALRLDSHDAAVAARLLTEITNRLSYLEEVGLGYLTLDRLSSTLSGGESQRINLSTSLGSSLVGSLYILDEPSIGLHQRDNHRLIRSLERLRDASNTIIVVEHDKDIMLEADYVVDIGPGAGRKGGKVVFAGTPAEMLKTDTVTARYLNGAEKLETPKKRRKGNGKTLKLLGCTGHNLKDVDLELPLGTLTVVAGVSGSGKSSLVNGTLQPLLSKQFYNSLTEPLPYRAIEGIENIDKVVTVDQSPLGRTPRSNPATYTGVFTDIRSLFVNLPEAKIRGYKPGRFSFNVAGGRCEACNGNGYKTIEMNFLPDVLVPCEECHGKRYNRETLEVRFKGKSVADVLDMTINQAVEFFAGVPSILKKIKVLQDIGLGYVKLGQPSSTLSGGENQRVKLATELAKRDTGNTLFILDEPTTGLHFDDIRTLMNILNRLVERGNTVLVIEHNLDVVRMADYVIDMGPDGGSGGGHIMAKGTPEEIAAGNSATAPFLRTELEAN